jgi:hypothetical protein
MKSAARLIDTYARRFDVTDTRVVLIDELAQTVGQAIETLGLADRLVLAPTRLESREGNTPTAWRRGWTAYPSVPDT